jgi:subtilase family serine protease
MKLRKKASMKKASLKNGHVLRIAVSVFIALISVSVSLTAIDTVQASTLSNKQHLNVQHLITAIPRWKDARKISTAHGTLSPASFGPSCLTNSQPSIAEAQCYSPQQLRNVYQINPLLKASVTGKGRKIVIIDASSSPTLQFDLHMYDQMFGLKDPKLNVIAPFGMPPVDYGVYTETALDVQTAHSIAPDAAINLVLTGDTTQDSTAESFFYDLFKAVKYAIDQNLGDVISISYGAGESCFDNAYYQYQHAILQEARAKHISVMISSGDSGAAILTCSSPNGPIAFDAKGTSGLDDPLATMVGGTTLHASVGKGTYQSETTWNESSNYYGATGGGFSSQFPRPTYQLGVTGNNHRGEPDVAWVGDPLTGVPIVLSSGGALYIVPIGGTSVGAPAWAGLVALFDQYAGRRLGFLNPGLYRILQSKVYYGKAFHDITTGNNTVPGYDAKGQSYTIIGYDAGEGWDAVTGAGTPKAAGLAPLLDLAVYTNDGIGL